MFRKRKVATPHLGHTPWNPIHGDHANLRQDGTFPFCGMMQIAAEDTYDNYVICRGFDTRILRFIDYAEGDANKPGISVAKPFGRRRTGTYEIGEIYPVMLPTQGNAVFSDIRQVNVVPPSPISVNWRVGQNPGVVSGGLDGGQPENLSDTIGILYDHNGKAINWLLIDGTGGGDGSSIRFTVVECVCDEYNNELQYITVQWTHYTGGCTEPPGIDEETGLIHVYDTCVLAYYTADFLTAGEVTGRATYFYERETCTGVWLIDSICGSPECQ